jgi:hypothetical protein
MGGLLKGVMEMTLDKIPLDKLEALIKKLATKANALFESKPPPHAYRLLHAHSRAVIAYHMRRNARERATNEGSNRPTSDRAFLRSAWAEVQATEKSLASAVA